MKYLWYFPLGDSERYRVREVFEWEEKISNNNRYRKGDGRREREKRFMLWMTNSASEVDHGCPKISAHGSGSLHLSITLESNSCDRFVSSCFGNKWSFLRLLLTLLLKEAMGEFSGLNNEPGSWEWGLFPRSSFSSPSYLKTVSRW